MSFGSRTRLSPKPNRPSPITRKAVGEPAGVAELMVFYCERAAGFCEDIVNEDESYFAALVRMFEKALTVANTLPESSGVALIRMFLTNHEPFIPNHSFHLLYS